MIRPLHEMVDLQSATPAAQLRFASEQRLREAFERASRGDENAQRELVGLRLAYLNWAYATSVADASGKSDQQ